MMKYVLGFIFLWLFLNMGYSQTCPTPTLNSGNGNKDSCPTTGGTTYRKNNMSGRILFDYTSSDITGNNNAYPTIENIVIDGQPVEDQLFYSGRTRMGFSDPYATGNSNQNAICYSASDPANLNNAAPNNSQNLPQNRINITLNFENSGYIKNCTYEKSSGNSFINLSTVPIANNSISSDKSSVCTNSSPSESVTFTGSSPSGGDNTFTYSWESSTDGTTWTTISGQTSISTSAFSPSVNTYYRRKVQSGGETSFSNQVLINAGTCNDFVWDGSTDSDWSTASNWDINLVPDINSNVSIPSGAPNDPVLSSSTSIKTLSVDSGKSIDLNGKELILYGNLTLNGTITGSGKFILGGSSPITITGNGIISNLQVNNNGNATISSGSSITITDTFYPISGQLITNNGNLIFRSDANGTAIISALGTNCSTYINGNVTIQRYINVNNNETYRFMGHPFSQDMVFSDFSNLPRTSGNLTNTYIYNSTYASPKSNQDSGDPAWTGVTNSSTWEQYDGAISMFSGSNPVTISATGPINQCSVDISLNATNNDNSIQGWEFVANPFWAYLSLPSINGARKNSLANAFYVWDPSVDFTDSNSPKNANSSLFNKKGRYYSITSSSDSSSNDPTKVAPFGGFFVKLDNATSGSLRLLEGDKSSSIDPNYSQFSFNKPIQNLGKYFKLKVLYGEKELDNLRIYLRNESSDGLDYYDVLKFSNPLVNIYSIVDDKLLSEDDRNLNFDSTQFDIGFNFKNPLAIGEEFTLNWVDRDGIDKDIILLDLETGSKIKLTDGHKYSFKYSNKFENSTRFKLYFTPISEENSNQDKELKIYPNPSSGSIWVGSETLIPGDYQYSIINQLGQIMKVGNLNFQKGEFKNLELNFDSKGSYIFHLNNGQINYSQKIIIK